MIVCLTIIILFCSYGPEKDQIFSVNMQCAFRFSSVLFFIVFLANRFPFFVSSLFYRFLSKPFFVNSLFYRVLSKPLSIFRQEIVDFHFLFAGKKNLLTQTEVCVADMWNEPSL